jgi:hypothetical protein
MKRHTHKQEKRKSETLLRGKTVNRTGLKDELSIETIKQGFQNNSD